MLKESSWSYRWLADRKTEKGFTTTTNRWV